MDQGEFNVSGTLKVTRDVEIVKAATVSRKILLGGAVQRTCNRGVDNPASFDHASRLEGTNHCYFLSKLRMGFAAVTAVCEAQNAYVVTITNDNENNHARALLLPDQSAFIGLSDVGAA